jgi:hypothetical protein
VTFLGTQGNITYQNFRTKCRHKALFILSTFARMNIRRDLRQRPESSESPPRILCESVLQLLFVRLVIGPVVPISSNGRRLDGNMLDVERDFVHGDGDNIGLAACCRQAW